MCFNNYLLCSSDIIKKEKGVKLVCHLLKDLTSYSPCARVLALRELLENSIFNEGAKYFGAKEKFQDNFEEMLLLHQNHKQVFKIKMKQNNNNIITKIYIQDY